MLSHGRIADELALAGHDVTLLEAEYFLKSSDLQSAKYAKTISLGGFPRDLLTSAYSDLTALSFSKTQGYFDNYHIFKKWHGGMNLLCEMLLTKHNETLEDLKEQKFDAIFNYHLNLCGTGLKEVLNIKTHFWISTCPIMEYMAYILGVPTPTSYVPPLGKLVMSDKPTYAQRFLNILEYITSVYTLETSARGITDVYRKIFGPSFPDIEEVVKDSPITFIVADEVLDFPRPILHNTIFVGGLGFKNDTKELQEPYLSEMEKGRLAFITHGGYNSLYESARAGVPIMIMPFFWDQFRNGKLAERNGWGLNFDKLSLLEGSEDFVTTLKLVLEDPKYYQQAQRTKRLLLTKPFSGTDKFVKYTEYIALLKNIIYIILIIGQTYPHSH
uniref:glucuronosyltransferase n=1 Tax=Acrobeloides nanus TaxID=290746 RepID=A0A914DF66_9BILA